MAMVSYTSSGGGTYKPFVDQSLTKDEVNALISSYLLRHPPKRQLSFDTGDVIALGALFLCVGEMLVAVIIAVGLLLGRIQALDAEEIILGCVGGSAIAAVAGSALVKKLMRGRKQ